MFAIAVVVVAESDSVALLLLLSLLLSLLLLLLFLLEEGGSMRRRAFPSTDDATSNCRLIDSIFSALPSRLVRLRRLGKCQIR